jgi:small-conductance mechanosensitive channel
MILKGGILLKNLILELALKFKNESISYKFATTLILILLLYIIKRSLSSFILKLNLNSKQTIKYKKILSNLINIAFGIFIIPIWMYQSQDIFTFLGIFSAGLAFAFRDIVANFIGWIMINTQNVFRVGDRIKIGESLGDVLEITWFYTTIIEVTKNNDNTYGQSTGRLISIPNTKVLTEDLVNETNSFPYIWSEIDVVLTSNSNWKKAKELMLKIADKRLISIEEEAKDSLNIACKILPIYYENLSHIIYTSIERESIILTLRFICRSRSSRNLKHIIVEDILVEFSKHDDIHFSS